MAHELASVWGGSVFSLDVQRKAALNDDPLPVTYPRRRLPSTKPLGRLQLPLPSKTLWDLLRSTQPLHGHLPSPGVALVLLLARVLSQTSGYGPLALLSRATSWLYGQFILCISGLLSVVAPSHRCCTTSVSGEGASSLCVPQ